MKDRMICPYVLRNYSGQKPKYGQASPLYMEMIYKWKHHFRDVVHKIHNNYGKVEPPIDFKFIEEYLSGFKVSYIPFNPRKTEIEVDGFCMIEGGDIKVFYATDLGEQRARFTIAHELVHVLQRFDLEFMADMEAIEDEDLRQMIIERIAEITASYYLAPKNILQGSYRTARDVYMLADQYNVSRRMMRICISDYQLATN